MTVLVLAASVTTALTPTTKLVSVNRTGTASGNADSTGVSMTPNGRFVLFSSFASDLVPTSKGNSAGCIPYGFSCPDVFLRNLKAGTTALVSVNRAGTASGNSGSTGIGSGMTPNGRYVLFSSTASDLVTNDTNGGNDAFVRDLKRGTTTLVSVNGAGAASGNADSSPAGITPNGRFVLFDSLASDLVADDTDFTPDVFVRDLKRATTTLVSVNSAGHPSGQSNSGGISSSGRYVLFGSTASDLVTNDTSGSADAFVRDLERGTTTLVSVNSAGTASGNGTSVPNSITPNGRYVLFTSNAGDLLANDVYGGVFVRDLKLGSTILVSVNSAGTGGSAGSDAYGGAITPDGRFVLFRSTADDLVETPKGNATACAILHVAFPCDDVFVRDLKLGTTALVSVNSAGTASGNGNSIPAGITPDGRFVLFQSVASDLIANDTNGSSSGMFVRDLERGTTTVVSINGVGTPAGFTPNGRFLLFNSTVSDLVGNDTNGASDVFVRQLR